MLRAQAKRKMTLSPNTHAMSVEFSVPYQGQNEEPAIQELSNQLLAAVAADLLEVLPHPARVRCEDGRDAYAALFHRLLVATGRRQA